MPNCTGLFYTLKLGNHVHYTRVSQKFCNIFITRDSIRRFRVLLPRGRTKLNCDILNLPDALRMLLAGLASVAWIHGFRSTWPCLLVKVLETWAAKFLQSSDYCTVIDCVFTFRITNVFWLLPQRHYGLVRTLKT